MISFIDTALSFPTVIFSLFLCISIILGLMTALGLLDLDTGADIDVGGDIGDVGDLGDIPGDAPLLSGAHAHTELKTGTSAEAIGLMSRLGLNGVPITIVISLLSLFGWLISFQIQLWLLNPIGIAILYYPLGLVIMMGVFFISVLITAQCCKPLRKVFKTKPAVRKKHLLGQVVIVNSLKVTMTYGQGILNNDGADLILNIRAPEGNRFERGSRVVLLQFDENQDAYHVISEDEFRGM